MKALLTAFILFFSLVVPFGCAASSLAPLPSRMDNRFLRLDTPILGLTTRGVIEKIGQPDSKISDMCKVPLREKDGARFIYGEAWSYLSADADGRITHLELCIIKDTVLGEVRHLIEQEGNLVWDTVGRLYDLGLIERVYLGKTCPDDSSEKSDSDLPL